MHRIKVTPVLFGQVLHYHFNYLLWEVFWLVGGLVPLLEQDKS